MLSLRHIIQKDRTPHEKKINFEKIIFDNKRSQYFLSHFEKAIREIEDFVYNNQNFSHLILPSALEDIATGLSTLLDEYTIKFLDHDIKQYRKNPSNNINEAALSAEEAIQELDKYYAKQNDLTSIYPAYDSLLSSLSNNYKNKIKLLINRLSTDIDLINRGFNKSASHSQIKVSHISQTGSDLHRQGGQVLIIEFSLEINTSKFNIVYKPSSVEADTFITGNMEQLAILDEQYIDCKSFVELINPGLDSQGKKSLPTYLIVPKIQLNDDNEIIDRYGYIEFISHSPWETINCAAYLEKLVRETAPRDKREINGKVEKYYNQEFETMLVAASNDSSCNYILRNKNEEDDFSFACGCLITVMTTLGIIDMHVKNMIVSNKLPVLIDLESSFKIDTTPTIEKTLVFQANRGSFSHKSTAPKEYAHLYNISGLQAPTIDIIEKNRSYTIFQIKNNKPVPYTVNSKIMANGITITLDILKNKKDEFQKWFECVKRFNICVRHIPLSTTRFCELRELIFDNLITKKESLEATISKFQTIFSDPNNPVVTTPNDQGIFNNSICHESVIGRMLIELSQGNIPVYFTLIANNQLFDFTNQLIPKNCNIQNKDVKLYAEDFFTVSCYTHIFSRFMYIMENIEGEKERLITELEDSVKKLEKKDLSHANLDIQVIRDYHHEEPDGNNPHNLRCCQLM
jgi:hypothetical protein